jgi:hypothetical protein
MLLALCVGKFDQASYLRQRERGKSLVEFFDGFAEIVAAGDGVRQNARARHDGPAGYFAGHALGELALRPIKLA